MGYSVEYIEESAEKLYTLYRAKRHHDSPAPQTVYYLGCSPEQTEANLLPPRSLCPAKLSPTTAQHHRRRPGQAIRTIQNQHHQNPRQGTPAQTHPLTPTHHRAYSKQKAPQPDPATPKNAPQG